MGSEGTGVGVLTKVTNMKSLPLVTLQSREEEHCAGEVNNF